MLYYLYSIFNINLFHYITVRAGIAFFISFFLVLFAMPKYIRWAKAKKANQPINKWVETHQSKQHTPTMGGAVFIIATIIASLLTIKLNNIYACLGFLTLIGFGAVGAIDDLGKILNSDNLAGLSSKGKMNFLIIVALIISVLLYYCGFPTTFYVPFLKTPLFDMGALAIIFWIIVIIASSNAVNITDGLDGLAAVPTVIALSTLGVIVYIVGNAVLSNYLLLPNIKGVGEVVIMASALAGGLLGFLWYNSYPAEVFMGDTGSLSIGAFIAYMAILGKSEVLLILIGFVFVMETLSVILQVGSFKLRGKRVFKMAPIHHHFELNNWAENKIIVRFWMIALIANILALITLKIR